MPQCCKLPMQAKFFLELLLPMAILFGIAIAVGISITATRTEGWITDIGHVMNNRTIESINDQLDSKGTLVEKVFIKIINDMYSLDNYSTNLFNNAIRTNYYYQNYYIVQALQGTGPTVDANGQNLENSAWYKHGVVNPSTYVDATLNVSATMNNVWQAMYEANTQYSAFFMGFPNGVMRNYPFKFFDNFRTDSFYCVRTSTFVNGYDPTCRGWYINATNYPGTVQLSPPYIDASTRDVIISSSKAVQVNGNLVGVVGADVSINDLYHTLLSDRIKRTGFAYLINTNGVVVVYPGMDMTRTNLIQNILITSEEKNAFMQNFVALTTQVSGVFEYTRNGAQWVNYFKKVQNTPYILCMTVSQAEMMEAATNLNNDVNEIYTAFTVGVIITAVIAFLIAVAINYCITSNQVQPIKQAQEMIDTLTDRTRNSTLQGNPPSAEMGVFYKHLKNMYCVVSEANTLFNTGRYGEALACYTERGLPIMVEYDNEIGKGVCYTNMANCYTRLHMYPESETYHNLAIQNIQDINREKPDNRNQIVLARRLMNKAVLYKTMQNYDEAARLFDESINTHRLADNGEGIAKVSGNLGQLYLEQGYLDRAIPLMEDYWDSVKNLHDPTPKQYAAMNKGILAYYSTDTDHYNRALRWFGFVLTQYQELYADVRNTCVQFIVKIYTDLGMNREIAHLQQFTKVVAKQTIRDMHFCIDVSGSMRGERLFNCKEAMSNIVDKHMKDNDKITYVMFDDQVHPTNVKAFTKSRNYHEIKQAIDRTEVKGGTAFYDALLYMINAAENVPGQSWIVALTDGQDMHSRNNYQTVVDRLANVKSTVSIIIITVTKVNPEIMQAICNASTNGQYILANDNTAIAQAFEDAMEVINGEVENEEL